MMDLKYLFEEDHGNIDVRLAVVKVGVVVVFAALVVAFWVFQVVQQESFSRMAENNRSRVLSLRAPRGVIFDRDGRVLVANRYSLNISLVREQTENLQQTLQLLANVANVDEQAMWEAVNRNRDYPDYQSIVLIYDASLRQVSAVSARSLELPGVVIEQVSTRYYPVDRRAAHISGYVSEITDTQLAAEEFEGLRSGVIVGQSGIEKAYNSMLMGQDGSRQVLVNNVGRELGVVGEMQAVEGQRLQLTVDDDLQTAAEDAFRLAGFSGAAVVLDPRSGEVLSLVSLPAYDPNSFALGVDRATWDSLNMDPLKPLQNRALQGRYSPGSIFKIVIAVAALEEGIVTPDFKVRCSGGANFYGRNFRCHARHGELDMYHAIEKSCNTYFYTLGNMLGIDTIHKWATTLGIGELTGIDLPYEVRGLMPSKRWKIENRGEEWYPSETISVAIGQGPVSITPISLAVMMATIANGGTRVTPYLLRAVDTGGGWIPRQPVQPKAVVNLKPETIETLRQALWMVVNENGTGGRGRLSGRDVIGKTGTVQIISFQGRQALGDTEQDFRDHGWFVFAAPKDNPEIAGAVFAEHSEHGYLAAPIAKHIMEVYFAKKDGQAFPKLPLPSGPSTGVIVNTSVVP